MSLYHEAAQILTTASEQGGSLKSIVFGKKDWKSDRKTLFALSTEAAKWSQVLSEVIEKSDVLGAEKQVRLFQNTRAEVYSLIVLQLSPVLSLVLTHDLLLSKKGVALPAKHGLHTAISRHKARLTSELTKARLRQGCPSLKALRDQVNSSISSDGSGYVHPRWIRINGLRTTFTKQYITTFDDYTEVSDLSLITHPSNGGQDEFIYIDPHVPDLVAIPGTLDLSSSQAYKEGRIIFQEKASCFPTCLLDPASTQGDAIDACAAPGNKTTHLALLLRLAAMNDTANAERSVIACEKDAARSETLVKMVKLAGADGVVKVRAKQDFLKLDPTAPGFANVGALLLDPSCSGSGIVGRDEARVTIHLPSRGSSKQQQESVRGKKRKRGHQPAKVKLDTTSEADTTMEEEAPQSAATDDTAKLATRLANLSSFQLRLLQHAMAFPAAKRITYSTCSLHQEENEHVATRALLSDVARERGWKVLRREEQVEGMRAWELRGSREAVGEVATEGEGVLDAAEMADACIRCEKGGKGGTMGFFVVGFVREDAKEEANRVAVSAVQERVANGHAQDEDEVEEEDEWEGFSDDGD